MKIAKIERTRGAKLQALRKLVFSENPLCQMCLNKSKIKEAKELDHIVPIAKGGTDARENLQGLCIECHREKTAQDFGVNYRPPVGVDGWPLDE